MKKNLIDTNLLYDLAGINDHNTSIDWDLLRSEMKKIGDFSISELSLFELYTHKSFTEKERKLVQDYIINNKINIVQSLPDISSFISHTNNHNLKNPEIVDQILSLKAKLEGTTLRSCIYLIFFITFYIYICNQNFRVFIHSKLIAY